MEHFPPYNYNNNPYYLNVILSKLSISFSRMPFPRMIEIDTIIFIIDSSIDYFSFIH